MGASDFRKDLFDSKRLVDKAQGPFVQELLNLSVLGVPGDQEDRKPWVPRMKLSKCLFTIHDRHFDVQKNCSYLATLVEEEVEPLLPVGRKECLIPRFLKEIVKKVSNQLLIVDHQDLALFLNPSKRSFAEILRRLLGALCKR